MTEESKTMQSPVVDPSLLELAQQRDEARQQAEAEAAQQLLRELTSAERQTPKEADTDKRCAHEEAEAKSRAEWEAKKQAREDEIQFAWERAVDLPDTALTAASVKRLGDMTERLTRRNMKICVTESIQTLCYEDLEFARLVLHPRKSMMNCFRFINRKALEYLKQELELTGEKAAGGSIGGDVPDELCYQWAEEYFRDMNAPEDKTEEDKDFVPKPYSGTAAKGKKKAEKKPAKPTEKKAVLTPENEAPASAGDPGQLALFEV